MTSLESFQFSWLCLIIQETEASLDLPIWNIGGGSYYLLIACSIIISIAVPVFFMISGALLIPKVESLKTLYKKRILKYTVILLVFSFVSWRYYSDWDMHAFDWLYFFRQLWSANWATSYWFLYSYISYLVLLPLIRMFAKALTDDGFKYLIVIYLSVQTLHVIDWIVWRGVVSYNSSLCFLDRKSTRLNSSHM